MQSKVKYINKRENVEINAEDLTSMDIDQLQDLKAEILFEIAQLKGKLDEADRLRNEGEAVDAAYINRMKAAKNHRGVFLQRISMEQGKRTREFKRQNIERSEVENVRFERQFMHAAKEYLPDEVYARLLKMTEERLRGLEGVAS